MNKIRRLLDTKALHEKQKEDEDRLMKIGIKKFVKADRDYSESIDFSIERIQASIDSGFTAIPDFSTVEELGEWLAKRNV